MQNENSVRKWLLEDDRSETELDEVFGAMDLLRLQYPEIKWVPFSLFVVRLLRLLTDETAAVVLDSITGRY